MEKLVAQHVGGQGSFGVRLTSAMALLQTVMRVPVRHIRAVLRVLYGCEISTGEMVEQLHCVVRHAEPAMVAITGQIRASPAVQADDTGWREDEAPVPQRCALTRTITRAQGRSSQR